MKSLLPVLCLFALIPTLPGAAVGRVALQKQDIALIQRIAENARDAEDAAERLEAFSRVPDEYSRPCHLVQLDALKEAVNAMAPMIDRIYATRDQLDDADRKAVTHIVVLAVELAQSANATILRANATEDTPSLSPEYRKLAEQCYHESNELVKALSAGLIELK